MFVVPYLKDKVDIPVVFCGVNSDPDEYGYPASNVTGVLERAHFLQSVIFFQQLVPSAKTLGFIVRDSPTGRGVVQQAQRELAAYSGISVVFKLPKTLDEAIMATEEFKTHSDGLYITFMDGLQDAAGTPLSDKDVAPILMKTFGKPTCSDWRPIVEYGALCGVITTGKEQGSTAAEMLVKAINGTPVSEIPITKDKQGARVLNVTTMKALGIKPKPHILKGVEFVETVE